jgi:hypothetical protein
MNNSMSEGNCRRLHACMPYLQRQRFLHMPKVETATRQG